MATPADPTLRIHCEFDIGRETYRSSAFVLKSKWEDQAFRRKLKKRMQEDLIQSILLAREPRFKVSFETDPGELAPDPV